jgi:hypothetical protein
LVGGVEGCCEVSWDDWLGGGGGRGLVGVFVRGC